MNLSRLVIAIFKERAGCESLRGVCYFSFVKDPRSHAHQIARFPGYGKPVLGCFSRVSGVFTP
jgi:hypothetical protein